MDQSPDQRMGTNSAVHEIINALTSRVMIWKFPPHAHRVFKRNPLVAVIVDLRFSPILRVAKGVPDFQDLVRDTFLEFQEESSRLVTLPPLGGVEIREEKVFSFIKDEKSKLSLTSSALTFDSRGHENREALFRDFEVGVAALVQTFQPIRGTRLGMRYINVVDKEAISKDLEKSPGWEEIINSPYIHDPTGLSQPGTALFNVEVTSTIEDSGNLTMRYGLLPEPKTGKPIFRIDLDRYIEAPLDPAQILPLLRNFSDDIFSAYRSFSGPDLIDWMEG